MGILKECRYQEVEHLGLQTVIENLLDVILPQFKKRDVHYYYPIHYYICIYGDERQYIVNTESHLIYKHTDHTPNLKVEEWLRK